MNARYTVSFWGPVPDSVSVGDAVTVSGKAHVCEIKGEVVDVTDFGSPEPKYVLGETTIALVSSRFDVEAIP